MHRDEILGALEALGAACPTETEMVVIGGAAGVLCRWIDRATADVDVAIADPRLAAMGAEIARVTEALGLPETWLNDGAKAFARVLPDDFRERLVRVGTFGRLRVHAIGRKDFIVMKLFAMRAEDVEDLVAVRPTKEEVEFARDQLARIAAFDDRKALLMRLYLDQGAG